MRLLEASVSHALAEEQLHVVKRTVEGLVQIQWDMEPKCDPRGGHQMSGMIPEDTDMEKLLRSLEDRGYWGVI